MKKLKLYLDTSVISHLKQDDAPEKMNINKPNISSDYNMEDFYKLREYLSLKYKDMPSEELINEFHKTSKRMITQIDEIRKAKGIIIQR